MRSHNTVGEVGRSKQEAAATSQCCDRKGMQLGGREKAQVTVLVQILNTFTKI